MMKPELPITLEEKSRIGKVGRKPRFSSEEVWAMRAAYRSGEFTLAHFSRVHNVSATCIHHVLNGTSAYKGV